jgi:hypothetical protein
VSAAQEPESPQAESTDSTQAESELAEPLTEEVDAIIVEAEERVVVQSSAPLPAPTRTMVPAVQAAAVAAGGFVAGAAVVGLVGRRHNRALAAGTAPRRRLLRRSRTQVEALQIISTRSLLVDVHMLRNGEQG